MVIVNDDIISSFKDILKVLIFFVIYSLIFLPNFAGKKVKKLGLFQKI